ncbi:hypothetical protein CFC35_41735 [Streptomyces sp. FBKL.4005]|uniref:hypothetical protein n=1 Tax=Streptomyces sp. FBKL.4005 TaxID=2015515 RepID=UPI000B976172|nr:hypothetical protein [Streptomyces sp. FBKL.4005]OYP10163.1 hypothetical protein CFC35_41735 [Streptomyces sp. FBKL.4005]
MYSLTPGFRVPAIQRGLSPAEVVLTKTNAGAGAAILASGLLQQPPIWAFGVVAGIAGLINIAPGRRSIARWAAVGVRHWRERRSTPRLTTSAGTTRTWTLYPHHGTMQDPYLREGFHAAFARALTFVANQARTPGVQVHAVHHATVGDYTDHTQTISVHIPKGLVGYPERVLGTIEGEFAALGVLAPSTPDPVPAVTGRSATWAALEDGRYAATARITAWPAETDGDLMPKLLLGQDAERAADRSLAVLYRPLPAAQSRRSAKWADAANGAFTTDKIKQEAHAAASDITRDALVQGACLVDIDAYLTVWGDSPEEVMDARWDASLTADRHRISLDWLTGQQQRAHLMTTPHGAPTRKGAIL